MGIRRPACQRTCPVTGIGGKDSVKGNRQGSLSRSITRRSDQNREIKYCFYFAILPQLVKKVRSDFFDKLSGLRIPGGRLLILLFLYAGRRRSCRRSRCTFRFSVLSARSVSPERRTAPPAPPAASPSTSCQQSSYGEGYVRRQPRHAALHQHHAHRLDAGA